jgi:hypothetical protein
MTPVDELAPLGFHETEHALCALPGALNSVCVENLDLGIAPLFEAQT